MSKFLTSFFGDVFIITAHEKLPPNIYKVPHDNELLVKGQSKQDGQTATDPGPPGWDTGWLGHTSDPLFFPALKLKRQFALMPTRVKCVLCTKYK